MDTVAELSSWIQIPSDELLSLLRGQLNHGKEWLDNFP